MSRELEIWSFIGDRLKKGERVVLLVVAESHGSSPGRAGYKMAVAGDELIGSIGGGVMEVNLVEQSRALLSEPPGALAAAVRTELIEQEHRKNSDHPSGMICSGRQAVIRIVVGSEDVQAVETIIDDLRTGNRPRLSITEEWFRAAPETTEPQNGPLPYFERIDDQFEFVDLLGPTNRLIIIGGGHCALALSELMSKMNFSIRIFDDRPDLNTLEKNGFADEITIVDSYEEISDHVGDGSNIYVVVMTLGYRTDEIVIRKLLGREFRYFGVLGSRAKMATLLRELRNEGFLPERLDAIRTPIGIPINSHTPEEIAVSIAAEIIAVKNA